MGIVTSLQAVRRILPLTPRGTISRRKIFSVCNFLLAHVGLPGIILADLQLIREAQRGQDRTPAQITAAQR